MNYKDEDVFKVLNPMTILMLGMAALLLFLALAGFVMMLFNSDVGAPLMVGAGMGGLMLGGIGGMMVYGDGIGVWW